MPTNPEIPLSSSQAPEVQQLIESSRAEAGALSEEVSAVSGTKSELNGFSKFFSKLWDARKELKNWNISKAVAILFWTNQQESQQASWSSTNTWSAESTTATDTQSESKENEPNDGKVSIEKYIPGIKYDLKYATTDNSFWWKVMYKKAASEYLRMTENATKKLSKAQEILKKQWYELKIWDAYRDHDGQLMLRNNYQGPDNSTNPKSSNVAIPKGVRYYNPRKNQRETWTSWSHHWTWNAIDLTLVNSSTWEELPMPTKFDDFSWNATWGYIKRKQWPQYKNAYILRRAMEQAWLYTINSEWWHYQTTAWAAHLTDSDYRNMWINF